MSILFVGSRAADIGGATVASTLAGTFDPAFSEESAKALWGAAFALTNAEATSDDTWYHFRIYTMDGMASSYADGYWFTIYDASNTALFRWDMNNGNHFTILYGDTTLTGAEGEVALAELTTYDIDIRVEVAGTSITVDIYQNGTLIYSNTADNTSGARGKPTKILFANNDMSSGSTFAHYYSEVIITDGESTLGWRLASLAPAADGTYTDWIGDYTGLTSFGDGSAIASDTAGQRQSWTLSAYGGPASPAGIRAVIASFNARKGVDESGPTNVAPFVRFAGTDVDGASLDLGGSIQQVEYAVNPQTGVAWDTADFATVEFGLLSQA